MMLRLDCHRLTPEQVYVLIVDMGWERLHRDFLGDGFRLLPVRAPRRLKHNRIRLRLCWVKRDAGGDVTFRMHADLDRVQ